MFPAPLIPATLTLSASSGALAAVVLREWLGIGALVIGILLSLGNLIGVFYGVKWKTAAAAEHDARVAVQVLAEAAQEQANVYRSKLDERDSLVVSLREELSKAAALPDMTRLLQEIRHHDTAAEGRDTIAAGLLERLIEHEKSVASSLAVVARLADHLAGRCPYLADDPPAKASRRRPRRAAPDASSR